MAGVARVSTVFFFIFCLAVVARAGSTTFEEKNPIRWVTDGLRDLESTILDSVGDARHALTFARFAQRLQSLGANLERLGIFKIYMEF